MIPKQMRGSFGRRLLTLTPLVLVVLWPIASAGQERNGYIRRKAGISLDIQQSLSPAKLGLQLLLSASSEEEIVRASRALEASYKHLRSAQETSHNLEAHSKFPDPLVKVRNAHIQWIRDRLRFCRDNDGHLIKREPGVTAKCIKGLEEAIHRLEIVVATEQ